MSFFEEAKIDFKKNNYLNSVRLFEEAIRSDGLNLHDQILSYEKIIQAYSILKKEIPTIILQGLSMAYEEDRNFEEAEKIYLQLFNKLKSAIYLKNVYICAKENGALRKAKEYANLYISRLIKEKRPNGIFDFVTTYESFLDSSLIDLWKVDAHMLEGNRSAISKIYNSYPVDDHRRGFVVQKLVSYAEKKTHYWQSENEILEILLDHLTSNVSAVLISKKQVAKLVLNIWMEKKIDHDLLEQTILLCKRYDLNHIGSAILYLLEDYSLAEEFENKIPKELRGENIDLGSDLFYEIAEESEEELIERNISFLKTMGRDEDVSKELRKLKKINPHHKLLNEKISKDSTADSEGIFQDLMKEVSLFTSNKADDVDEKLFDTMANFYDYEYIQDNYEDMIIGLQLLNLPNVALAISEKVERVVLDEEAIINLEYLKLEILMTLSEYYKVRDMADDMLRKYPVKGDELLSLLYIRAEAYMKNEQFAKAYDSFKEVYSIDDSYRLVGQRLKELEKYK